MVWAGISMNHRAPMYVINENVTGKRYLIEIVQPLVVPRLLQIAPGAWFQDNNARLHRASVVTDVLQQNVLYMDWPAYSPALSPTDRALVELGRRVRSHYVPAVNLHQLAQQ